MRLEKVTVSFQRKKNLGNYESADASCMLTAYVEPDDHKGAAMEELWRMAKDNVQYALAPYFQKVTVDELYLGLKIEEEGDKAIARGEFLKLEDLLGKHTITGCEYSQVTVANGAGNAIDFIIDGVEARAIENSDGQDSFLSPQIDVLSPGTIENRFSPVDVIGVWDKESANDIIVLFDDKTGKPIIEVGTENYGDSPMFRGRFNPQNMSINHNKEESNNAD